MQTDKTSAEDIDKDYAVRINSRLKDTASRKQLHQRKWNPHVMIVSVKSQSTSTIHLFALWSILKLLGIF